MLHKAALRLVEAVAPAGALSELEITIKEFLLAKKGEQLSAGTLEKYGLRLDDFAAWLHERGITRPAQITRLSLREWAATLPESWAASTRRHVLTVVRGFLSFCVEENLVDGSLPGVLKPPKEKRQILRTLSRPEVDRLLEACGDSLYGKRDAAIISLMVDSGLRAGEVCRLERDDIVFDFPFDGRLINFAVVLGKNGHQEPAHFGARTVERLRVWLKVRPNYPGVKTVFISLHGRHSLKPLTRNGLYQIIRLVGVRARVPGVTPHSLRRTFAILLDDAGHTSRQIMALGRWSSIQMVERYTAALQAAKVYHSPLDNPHT